jgi:hypothetical protein
MAGRNIQLKDAAASATSLPQAAASRNGGSRIDTLHRRDKKNTVLATGRIEPLYPQ